MALGLSMMYKNIEMLAASEKHYKEKGRYARLDYVANMAYLSTQKVSAPLIRRRRLKTLRFETERSLS